MPRGLRENTEVLGVPGLVDRTLEYGADPASLIQTRLERSALGHHCNVEAQIPRMHIVPIESLVAPVIAD